MPTCRDGDHQHAVRGRDDALQGAAQGLVGQECQPGRRVELRHVVVVLLQRRRDADELFFQCRRFRGVQGEHDERLPHVGQCGGVPSYDAARDVRRVQKRVRVHGQDGAGQRRATGRLCQHLQDQHAAGVWPSGFHPQRPVAGRVPVALPVLQLVGIRARGANRYHVRLL